MSRRLSILVEHSVLCDKCGDRDAGTGLKKPERYFLNLGWRVKNGKNYCESCYNKLKSINHE